MLAYEFNGKLGNVAASGSDVRLGCVPSSEPPKLHPFDLTWLP
jgi:hypothetical protein